MKRKVIALIAFSLLMAAAYSQSALGGTNSISMDSDLTSTTASTVGKSLFGGTSTADTLIGKCSSGVGIAVNSGSTGYAVATQHKSGSREFGSSFDSTNIFYQEVTATGKPMTGSLSASDSSNFMTSWTSM